MARKIIPITRIEMEDGKEVSREESRRGEITCDFCGKVIEYPENDETCQGCGKDVCYDCRKNGLEIPATDHERYSYHCPDCVKFREPETGAVKTLYKSREDMIASLKVIESNIRKARDAFDGAKDRALRKEKKFYSAEKKFKEYQQQVESGKYKSHREMIRKYKALLKLVPEGSKLAEDIEYEIDSHEMDCIGDVMDKARHGEL